MESLTAKYKPYPAYRPSGVEWLGEIPTHWEVKRLKMFANVQLSNVDKKSEEDQAEVFLCNYVDVYYNEQISPGVDFMSATASEEQIRRFSLRKGDVLITKDSETWTDIAVPAVVTQDLPGVLCGYHLAHIRPDNICDGTFLSRAFSAMGLRDQFHVSANGITRFGLTGDSIRSGEFPIPPLPEQQAIAAFLDRETARIDALVAKKERLIELLQEKRAALITRAVTRGLDPDVQMKDSSVEWLGEIPAHWEMKRLKQLVKSSKGAIKVGPFGSQLKSSEMIAGEIKVYNQRTVIDRDFTIGQDYISLEKFVELRAFEVFPDDLLITSRGTIGMCAVVPAGSEQGILHPCLIRIQFEPCRVYNHFIEILIQDSDCALEQFKSRSNATTIEVIYSESLREVWLTLPPLSEQRVIAEFLDRETANLDTLIAKVREAIDRLRELRAALISAAVTGRIDVRGEAG